MRFMYRGTADEELQSDLDIVQKKLNSGYFMVIDIFFWALFLTIFTTPAQQSIKLAVIIFIGYYVSGVCLFILLKCLLKD